MRSDYVLSWAGFLRWSLVIVLCLTLLWLISWVGARWLVISAPLEHADVIVVLSGSSTFMERTAHAAELYKQHRAPAVVVTNDDRQGGWSSAEQRNPYFYERERDELVRLGVPARNIEIIMQPVSGTSDEAILLGEYARQRQLRSILLVTSAYHARRALWAFKRLSGVSTVGIDPVPTGRQTPPPATWWLHVTGWELVPGEYLKFAYYRLQY